jgi:hypothetical protein
MFGGWQAAPVEAERPPRHEAAPMMSTDPRSLAALLHEFVIHEALLRYRLTERFTGFANATSLTVSHHGGAFVTAAEASGSADLLTFSMTPRGLDETAAGLVAMLRGREATRRALSPTTAALLARIDARRDRLLQEHGTFPDSGTTIRELRDREA